MRHPRWISTTLVSFTSLISTQEENPPVVATVSLFLDRGLVRCVPPKNHGQTAKTVDPCCRSKQQESAPAASHLHSALAWRALHKNEQAISELNESLRLDPLLDQPYDELAAIYREEGNGVMLRDTYERRLKAFPQSLEARAALASPNQAANRPSLSQSSGH